MPRVATPEQVRDALTDYQDQLPEDTKAVVHIAKEKLLPATPFVFLFVENFEAIAGRAKLTAFEMRVCMRMMAKMQYGNQVSLTQAALASEMDVARQQINRVFKRLQDIGVLVQDEHGSVFFNLELVLKGKFSNLREEFKPQYELSRQRNQDLGNDTEAPFTFEKKPKGKKAPKPQPQPDMFEPSPEPVREVEEVTA